MKDGKDLRCPELPDHLIHDIFLNLPFKTLVRFLNLSKRWNNILTSTAFDKQHSIKNSTPRNTCITFLLNQYEVVQYTISDTTLASWSKAIRYNRSFCCLPPPAIRQLPIKFDINQGYVLPSSCNGMLCFLFSYWNSTSAIILVWNPFTGKFRQITCPAGHHTTFSFVGLGYDHVTEDYKIVLTDSDEFERGIAQITSLSSADLVWRTIDTPSWGIRVSNAITFDGDIYWISYINSEDATKNLHGGRTNVVLKFNVANERLTILPSPIKEYPLDREAMELCEYGGTLFFFNYTSRPYYNPCWANIWSLGRDNDGEAIWNFVLDVPYMHLLQNGRTRICGFTTGGDLIICFGYYFFVYFVQEKRYREVHIRDYHILRDRFVLGNALCVLQNETLIPPCVDV